MTSRVWTTNREPPVKRWWPAILPARRKTCRPCWQIIFLFFFWQNDSCWQQSLCVSDVSKYHLTFCFCCFRQLSKFKLENRTKFKSVHLEWPHQRSPWQIFAKKPELWLMRLSFHILGALKSSFCKETAKNRRKICF